VYPGTGDADENAHNVMKHPCLVETEHDRFQYDDGYYLQWMQSRCVPALQAWRADLVIVCNGLDAHRDDPLAGLNLTNLFYREATRMLQELEVPLLYILEGGYSPEVVRSVSHDVVQLLAGDA
jgi:acetoin utilization deacetylase AcuC-like enzyme